MIHLVVTHGRDQTFQIPETEAREWQAALRFGLKRVEAPYHADLPFSFAFYGDLWRPDTPGGAGGRGLEEAPPDTRQIQIELARDLATAAGLSLPPEPPANERGLWDALAGAVTTLDNHFGLGEVILQRFLSDVAQYFSDDHLRTQVMDRVAQAIQAVNGDVVLLGHSMGSIVGYDLLSRRLELPVRALVTFGSPIGAATCRKHVANAGGETPFPPRLPRWINLYYRQDIATVVRLLAPYFPSGDARSVEDRETLGRQAGVTDLAGGHDPLVYLSSMAMGEAIRAVVDEWLSSHPGTG